MPGAKKQKLLFTRGSHRLPGDPVQGALTQDGGMVQGWCWSPRRAAERLQVTLLVDGVGVAHCVAARLRSELVRPGLCDGYHGFALALPAALSPFAVIEARERESGYVFGRILPRETAEIHGWRARAAAAEDAVSALQDRLHPDWGRPRRARLSAAFGVMATRFQGRAGTASPLPAAHLPAGLRLPRLAAPAVSLILDGGAATADLWETVRALAPLLAHHGAELVVTDDGAGTASAGLASLPGLAYCRVALPPGAGRANRAAEVARGGLLVFLRAGAVSPLGVATLLDRAGATILIGGLAAATARQAGLDGVFAGEPGSVLRTGLSLLVPRETFLALGSLDPGVEDGADLAVLDFALRARAAGVEAASWRDVEPLAARPAPAAARARRRFVARWGAAAD